MNYYDKYILGVDLAEQQDYTALTVLGRRYEVNNESDKLAIIDGRTRADFHKRYISYFDLRHFERLHRVPYPDIADRIRVLLRVPDLYGKTSLVLDASGVGRAFVEDLVKKKLCSSTIGITITAGSHVSAENESFYNVPKAVLVSTLQLLLESERLRFSKELKDIELLKDEVKSFRAKISKRTGYESFEAEEGKSDDIVLSLAIGCWWAVRTERNKARSFNGQLAALDEQRNKFDPMGFRMK